MKAKSLALHSKLPGKIQTCSPITINTMEDLSIAYSPYVSEVCLEIKNDPYKVDIYTSKPHTIAVVSDGSAVLGLGNIGPLAALPVMEGKALLFKRFANIDAVPICIDTQNPDEIIQFCKNIAPSFGGINLEDIRSPECVFIEDELKNTLNIPVFHDDQHGTAVVVLAALINACRLTKKPINTLKVSLSGTGAAGSAIAKILQKYGISNIYAYNAQGVVSSANISRFDSVTQSLINDGIIQDNPSSKGNDLASVISGTDVFIGVSVGNIVTTDMIKTMNNDPVIFALANPTPEIMPEDAFNGGARIVATGRSDYPNQVNNVLAFPGIFKGVLTVGARQITDEMKLVSAKALSSIVSDYELTENYIIPSVFNERVVHEISKAVQNEYKK